MKDTMDELKDTWDQTFLMMPDTGMPAMFGDGHDSNGEWLLQEEWWEKDDDDITAITAQSADNPSGSGGTSEFGGWGTYDEPEEEIENVVPDPDDPPVAPPVAPEPVPVVPVPVPVPVEQDTTRCAGVYCNTASQQYEPEQPGQPSAAAIATIETRQERIARKQALIDADKAKFAVYWENKGKQKYKAKHGRDPSTSMTKIYETKYLVKADNKRFR